MSTAGRWDLSAFKYAIPTLSLPSAQSRHMAVLQKSWYSKLGLEYPCFSTIWSGCRKTCSHFNGLFRAAWVPCKAFRRKTGIKTSPVQRRRSITTLQTCYRDCNFSESSTDAFAKLGIKSWAFKHQSNEARQERRWSKERATDPMKHWHASSSFLVYCFLLEHVQRTSEEVYLIERISNFRSADDAEKKFPSVLARTLWLQVNKPDKVINRLWGNAYISCPSLPCKPRCFRDMVVHNTTEYRSYKVV